MSSVRLLVKEQDGTVGVSLQRDGYLDADPTVFAPFESPLSDTDREDLRWYLEDYLVHPYAVWQEDGERIAGQLDGWGTALFNALIGEGKPGRDAYVKAREAETWPELMLVSRSAGFLALPWELLKDPARTTPLALDFAGITRTIATEAKAAEMVTGETLRVLMVIARPRGEKDVGYQMVARPLLSRLAAVRGTVALEVLRPPTLEALQARLNAAVSAGEPFHILHFDGHGAFGVKAPTEFSPNQYKAAAQGFLAFEQANGEKHLVSAADFALVLNRARVPLLVLNACQSGTLQEGVEAQAGTATRVLEAGAAAVVAMGYSVYAVAAAEFMTAFYDALFRGEALAQAVAEGRKRMKTRPERPSPKGDLPLDDWLVPVLYARRAIDFGHLKPAPRQPAALSLEAELDRVRGRPAAAAAGSDPLAPVDGVFFGRDAAFYRLERTLRLKRAVVIQGLGGSGKTELAKAFARWLRDSGGLDRADFIHFHSFEPGLPSFGLDGVVTEIGMALFGTDFVGKTEGPEQRRKLVLNVLREHRMLLVWDNFESVRSMPAETTPPLDEAGQAAIRDFVAALTAPGGKSGLIVTSRAAEEWLGAVDHLPLGGLDREAANEYVDHLLALSAAGRERRKDKAFGDLLQFLAGHPLSLRLIIPQLTHRNPAALLAELSPPPLAGEGQGGGRRAREFDSTQRLQNLDACVHYSFRHLPEAVRRLLPALTLFEGVADAVVLMLVSNVAEVPDRYRGITREQWTAALDQAAGLGLLTSLWGGQYRIHPALPKYLDGLWRDEAGADYAGERTAAEDAFVTAVADFGRWLDRQIQGGSAETAMSLIDLQRRTLGRAIDEALAAERWPQAQDILQPLNEFWNARGLTEEAQAWTSRIHKQIESPQGTPPDFDTPVGALWLFITGAQANRALSAGDLATAYTAYDGIREALETTSSDKARSHLAVACHQLGIVAQKRGDLDDAERWYRKSLEMWQALGDRPGMATTYHQLGMVAQERGDLDDAERWYRKAVEIDEALGDRPGMAQSYHQLGNVGYLRGDLDDAERWYRKSLEIGEALANGPVMALTYGQLGLLAETRGSKAEALAWMVRCVALFDQFPHPVTRSAPQHLARLAGELGMAALEEAWKAATGGPLPDAVRTWVSTPPATS